MTCLMTVEDTLLGDDHLEAIGPSVDDRRADAPARALARNQKRIDALGGEMRDERRPPEGARRALPQLDFPRLRGDLVDDLEAPAHFFGERRIRAGTSRRDQSSLLRPALHPRTVESGDVDDRDSRLPSRFEQTLNVRQRFPTGEPATPRPLLDRLEQRLRPIPKNPAVEIDQNQRRPFTEAEDVMRTFAERRLILSGQEIVPHSLSHR